MYIYIINTTYLCYELLCSEITYIFENAKNIEKYYHLAAAICISDVLSLANS